MNIILLILASIGIGTLYLYHKSLNKKPSDAKPISLEDIGGQFRIIGNDADHGFQVDEIVVMVRVGRKTNLSHRWSFVMSNGISSYLCYGEDLERT
tara:strand:+ start:7187 stop:7474 length:288 start_codon:yes stop_codon:yes gene_type:complete